MRTALLILASAVLVSACEDILPVETIDLCEQPNPPSTECPQCDGEPFARDCPQCKGDQPASGCENAAPGAGSDGGAMDGAASVSGAGGRGGSGGSGGTAGGSAGRGGSAAEDAGACAACPNAQPLCFEGSECVQCIEHDDCAVGDAPAAPRCEPESHACVECLTNDDCAGAEPKCEPGLHECVECLTNPECDASEPVCGSDHRCGPCAADPDCADREGATHCDTAAESPREGECVQCTGHGQCGNPAPQCTNGACTACTDDAACETRPGTEVCNTRANVETSGQCVECTGETEAAQCEGNACKQSTGTCTDVEKGTLTPCSPCEADSECVVGARCALHAFDDDTTLGPFCFFERAANSGCAGVDMVSAVRPYSRVVMLTSVDNAERELCLPITTCAAIADATVQKTCTSDLSCGVMNVDDGDCPVSGPAAGKCSYQCNQDYDCLSNVGFTNCSGAGAGAFCQP